MFTFIIGPMKSGKSLELIAQVSPLEFSNKQVLFVQPEANVREDIVKSRAGATADKNVQIVKTLYEVKGNYDVIGIDEIHMFPATDVNKIRDWLMEGKLVVASGLDLDYRGKMPFVIQRLYGLKPDSIILKLAVCDKCKNYNAKYTQILDETGPIYSGLPAVVPDNGKYIYEARCRRCFEKGDYNE